MTIDNWKAKVDAFVKETKEKVEELKRDYDDIGIGEPDQSQVKLLDQLSDLEEAVEEDADF